MYNGNVTVYLLLSQRVPEVRRTVSQLTRLFRRVLADTSVGQQFRIPFRVYATVCDNRDGSTYEADPDKHQFQAV